MDQVHPPPVLCSQCHGEVGQAPPQRPPLPKIIIDVGSLYLWCILYKYDNDIFILSPLKEMKLKILGSPLPSRVEDVEMEMDTLGPPKPTAVQQRKKSRVKTFWGPRSPLVLCIE